MNEYIYLGIVGDIDDRGFAKIEQRNKFSVGDEIEIMKPDGTDVKVTVKGLYTEDGESVDSCPHPKQVLYVELSVPAEKYDILRAPSKDN